MVNSHFKKPLKEQHYFIQELLPDFGDYQNAILET
jgi:hypothetical protein